MQRIADHSKALHGGSSWSVDSTIRSEFGWGSHTAHTAIVTYGEIHSHATVYVSEDKILIILASDPDYGSFYHDTRNEDKFAIELADITDVVIKREPSIVGKLHKAVKEVRRQSIFVFLKGAEACVIDTYDSDFSAKVIMMTWHANIARRSAGLGTLLNSEDHDVAAAFYHETVACLKCATRHTEVVDIVEDFSREVLTDLELKDFTFRSRELIITCLKILHNLLYLPAVLKGERGGRQTEVLPVQGNQERLDAEAKKTAHSAALSANRNSRNLVRTASADEDEESMGDFTGFGTSLDTAREAMSTEQEHRLKIIAVDRMKLIFCILKMFSSLLFSSESISSRFALLLGPSPLDLQAWLKLLIPDTYKLVCKALGCSDTSTTAQIEAEIELSLQNERNIRSRSNTHRAGDDSAADTPSYASTPRKSISSVGVADSMLTPLSARMRTLAETMAPDEYAEAMAQLTPLRQSVRDLQGMLVFDVHRIFGLAKAMVKGNHQNTNVSSQLSVILGSPVASGLLELKQINSLGDLYIRERFWEESLEEIVSRIAGILQDMADSPHITTGPTAALSTTANISAPPSSLNLNSLNNLHQHPSMRLNFTLMSNNHNTHSTNSLPGVSNSFVSHIVPPSPRSPLSTARSNLARPTRYRSNSAAPSPMVMSTFSPRVPNINTSLPPGDHRPRSSGGLPPASAEATSKGAGTKPPFQKKGPQYFFNSAHSLHGIADGDNEVEKQPTIEAPLRTQEILLFYLATLLRTLAMDSYQIREVMRTDLVSYWRNIIGIFNILCPRPNQDEDSVVENHVSSSGKFSNSTAFAFAAPSSPTKRGAVTPNLKRKNKDEVVEDIPGTKDSSASSSKFVKKFFGMFSSTTKESSDEPDKGNHKRPDKRIKSVKEAHDEVQDHTAHIDQTNEKLNAVKIPSLYVFDYGKPKYGLSGASWTLLVLARMAIEDVILRLKLNPAIILAEPKVKVDTQLLNDLGSRIGINGGIAEGDSEDEYSVSQYNGVESDGSVDLGLGLDNSSVNSTAMPPTPEAGGKSAFATLAGSRRTSKPNTGGTGAVGLQITVPADELLDSVVIPAGKLHMPKKSGSPMPSKFG